MKAIYAYTLKTFPHIEEQFPIGAQFLDLRECQGVTSLSVLADVEAPKVKVFFYGYGIGWELPKDAGDYVGTFRDSSDGFIWHIFMKGGSMSTNLTPDHLTRIHRLEESLREARAMINRLRAELDNASRLADRTRFYNELRRQP